MSITYDRSVRIIQGKCKEEDPSPGTAGTGGDTRGVGEIFSPPVGRGPVHRDMIEPPAWCCGLCPCVPRDTAGDIGSRRQPADPWHGSPERDDFRSIPRSKRKS